MRYMDYDKFKKGYEAFEKWSNAKDWEYLDNDTFKNSKEWDFPNLNMFDRTNLAESKRWLKAIDGNKTNNEQSIREKVDRYVHDRCVGPVDNDGNFYNPESQNDLVNSPAHYTRGNQECIDTIEEAIQDAPDPVVGSLQYQVLKYILRMWLKGNPLRDAQKAQWYLARLINKLENDD